MGVSSQATSSCIKTPSCLRREMFLLLLLPLLGIEAVGVQDSFDEAGLVKDLKILAPEKQLEVSYPGLFPLAPGDSLVGSEAREIPSIRLEEASKGKLYTVAMVDPDAPSRKNPRAAQWLHWILTNDDGDQLLSGENLVGEEVITYAGPSPPKGSGPHRYVLLVWEQQQTVSMESPRSRARGDISKIAKSLDLGAPIAGNFFFAENK